MVQTLGVLNGILLEVTQINESHFDGETIMVTQENGNIVLRNDTNLGEVLADNARVAKKLLLNGCSISMTSEGTAILIPVPLIYPSYEDS